MPKRKQLAILLAAGLAGPAFGQSGTFTFVTGDVTLQRKDGQRVAAARGTPVNPGDAVATGQQGMAQLTMVDQAKIALRPNTQFEVVQYADRPDADTGSLLSLVRGTMRAFTGLLSARNRDRFLMKTKIATVGIRGSGNVLFAGTATACDPDRVDATGGDCDITVNHTIEGSHEVAFGDMPGAGMPGGAPSLVTGPGQTVLVTARGDVRYIPMPGYIGDAATNPVGAKDDVVAAAGGETRNFGPSEDAGSSLPPPGKPMGNNGLGFTFTDAAGNLAGADPIGLRDIVIAGGATLAGQATPGDIDVEGGGLRGYTSYAGLQSGLAPSIAGGTLRDAQSYASGGLAMTAGRWENASLAYLDGAGSLVPGSVHWIQAGSGYPAYLSDVLTGTATYNAVMHTSPTNQANTVGTLTTARLDVNFSNRTLDAAIGVSLPQAGSNGGGSWQLSATGVPFALGAFFASTGDRLRITNGNGQNSASNAALYGSFEGSFVGTGLQGAILGYNFSDQTSSSPSGFNTVNGVIGFQGPSQNAAAAYRDGLVSDAEGALSQALIRNYATANRPDEVTVDAQGRADAFAAPLADVGGHLPYARGTASVAESGMDPATGLVWGRWAGGVALVTANGQQRPLSLENRSLHYVFSGVQAGPVTLPLTGSASYELIGHTTPTDAAGHAGTLNSASLAANFSARTVDVGVNVTIAGQSLAGSASNVPIYRDQYFSAFRGTVPSGIPVPQLLNITCVPACSNPSGSIDGFFAGRTGQGAGLMYNLNGASGAAAFRRPGS